MRPELTITRHNALVDPLLHVWGWEIPVYLFLGGLVAGIMIIVGAALWRGRAREAGSVAGLLPGVGLVLLSLGMLALFLDLEHKRAVFRLYLAFRPTSPMSWGAWILLLVYPSLAAAALATLPAAFLGFSDAVDRLSDGLAARPGAVRAIAAVNIAIGAALGIYTGILLSAFVARPFWNSAILGILFLVSGASSAAAFAHMAARDHDEAERLVRSDTVLLGVELLVIALFLIGLVSSSRAQIDGARLVLGGPFTAVFWVGVVGLGILLPLVIQSLALARRIAHSVIAPIFVLGGGLLLRFVIVYAGQYSHWPRGVF